MPTCGAYCERAREVATNVVKLPMGVEVCATFVHHKGDGINPKDDNYGVDYLLPCKNAVTGMDMVVQREKGGCAIVGCQPRLPVLGVKT